MEIVYMILLVVAILGGFVVGNVSILFAVSSGDASALTEEWLAVIVAVVIDLILLYIVVKKIINPAISSLRMAGSGYRNRSRVKKKSAKLTKNLEKEKLDINRLEELRKKGISVSSTIRTSHFCQLIEMIDGKEQLQDCLSKVSERQSVLDEINDIENRILKIAESYKNVGDTEKCLYYLRLIKSKKLKPKITALEQECDKIIFLRNEERKASRLWKKVFLTVLAVSIMISAVLYIEDTPYRELRSMIKDQSLTAEMCDWKNRYSEKSYYEYFQTKKGYKFLASELTQLHRNDDVNKAMWLLCIQPDCIDGFDLCASSSFINWIVDYAKTNGVRSTDTEEYYGLLHYVTYSVDGYQIILSSYYDNMSTITTGGFDISDGNKKISVQTSNTYAEVYIPTIK